MNTIDAMNRVIDKFEQRERGIPQAHMASKLAEELREAIDREEAQTVEPVFYAIQFESGSYAGYAYPAKDTATKLSEHSHKPNKVIPLFAHPAPSTKPPKEPS